MAEPTGPCFNEAVVVEPMQPALWTDRDWSDCYALHIAAHAERGTQPNTTASAYRISHLKPPQGRTQHSWVAREQNAIVAKADLSFPTDVRALGALGLYVRAEHRRRGAAKALLRPLVGTAIAQGCAQLDVGVDHADGRTLAERAGAVLMQEITRRTLALSDVPWARVDQWIEAGEDAAPGARIIEFERLPDELAEAYLALHAEVEVDVPRAIGMPLPELSLERWRQQEEQARELGWQLRSFVVREADGGLSALSEVSYDPALPTRVRQELTGVGRSYRGLGRAKWLKAALLRRFQQLYPQATLVTTNNDDHNSPMVAINRSLGFVDHMRQGIYRFDTAQLAKRLGPLEGATQDAGASGP